jgi:hypothetical protein
VSVVYLHIGRGKTGTTAIQATLSAMREQLLDHGIHYVMADDQGTGSGHQRFAKSFISTPPAYMVMPTSPEVVREAVRQEIATSKSSKIVISSENFTMADMHRLKQFLLSIPTVDAIRIVFFVRSQDELAESQYNQFVKLKGMTASFDEFLKTAMDETDFDTMASTWAERFGEEALICRIFDAGSNDAVIQFLKCVGVDWAGIALPSRSLRENESLGYFALQMLRALNRAGIRYDNAQVSALSDLLRGADVPALMLDADAAAAYRESFSASNLRFSSRFLGKPLTDLGGRRFGDEDRDTIRAFIRSTPACNLFMMDKADLSYVSTP